MKNTLVIAGVLVSAIVVAIGAWAVFGGSGGGRKAVLLEPTESGSVGQVTLNSVTGADHLPVRSFSWRFDCETSQYGCNARNGDIELLRNSDEFTPGVFTLGTNVQSTVASLLLFAPAQESAFLQFDMTSAQLSDFTAGSDDRFALRAVPTAITVTSGRGPAPEIDSASVIGNISFPSQRATPIYRFNVGYTLGAHINAKRAVVRIPLNASVAALVTNVRQQTLLTTVPVTLQDPSETAPHASFQLGSAKVMSITISDAAGITPTVEVELAFRSVQITSHGATACWNYLSSC